MINRDYDMKNIVLRYFYLFPIPIIGTWVKGEMGKEMRAQNLSALAFFSLSVSEFCYNTYLLRDEAD